MNLYFTFSLINKMSNSPDLNVILFILMQGRLFQATPLKIITLRRNEKGN